MSIELLFFLFHNTKFQSNECSLMTNNSIYGNAFSVLHVLGFFFSSATANTHTTHIWSEFQFYKCPQCKWWISYYIETHRKSKIGKDQTRKSVTFQMTTNKTKKKEKKNNELHADFLITIYVLDSWIMQKWVFVACPMQFLKWKKERKRGAVWLVDTVISLVHHNAFGDNWRLACFLLMLWW